MRNPATGRPQRVTARAPGRVNLIGEHTDYNDGFVLPMALPFATSMALERRDDDRVELHSVGFERASFRLGDNPAEVPSWARYVAGMAWFLAADGLEVGGFSAELNTDIPVGASLSSSAALEVATGFGLCGLAGVEPDPVHIAKLGQRVENEIIGIQSGIMDQLISAAATAGNATMIDCRSLEMTIAKVPAGSRVVIMDTMTRRELKDSEYDLRRKACERAAAQIGVDALRDATIEQVEGLPDGRDRQRARHVVTENQRVLDAVVALDQGDSVSMGELMNSSHHSLSEDYAVSSKALDDMAAIARSHPGCFGARMTGGGFAGSAVALVDERAVADFVAVVTEEWTSSYRARPDVWVVDPSAGASVSVANTSTQR